MAVVRSPKDLVAGLMFIAIGITAIVIASNYTLGTAARMGPGYFPRILSILLIARHPEREPKHRAAVPLHERAKRFAVALARPVEGGCCFGDVHSSSSLDAP